MLNTQNPPIAVSIGCLAPRLSQFGRAAAVTQPSEQSLFGKLATRFGFADIEAVSAKATAANDLTVSPPALIQLRG